MLKLIAVMSTGVLLSGCALLAAGVVGGVVASDVEQHRQWCAYHYWPRPECR